MTTDSSSSSTQWGVCIPRHYPPALAVPLAHQAESAGLDEVWFVEDCFYSTAPPLAAAVLSATSRVRVGLGILPAVVRTAAVTAMEIATLEQLGPGRVVAGIGHGVQSWMAQMGVRPSSPLTTLGETLESVRALLHGDRLDRAGAAVTTRDIALEFPPTNAPPVIAGVRGDKSLALAGRVCDGVLLDSPTSVAYLERARSMAAAPADFQFRSFSWWSVGDDALAARRAVAPALAHAVAERYPMITALPFADELDRALADGGQEALANLPAEYWTTLGAVGTMNDAAAHLRSLDAAGLHSAAFFLHDDPAVGREQIDRIAEVTARLR